MSFVFDSSSIFYAIKENKVEHLVANHTVELTRYELSNVIWKDLVLHKRIRSKESNELIDLVKSVLGTMNVLKIDSHEKSILDVAAMLTITFYDACYVFYAKEIEATLVTEDSSLTKRLGKYVTALRMGNILSPK